MTDMLNERLQALRAERDELNRQIAAIESGDAQVEDRQFPDDLDGVKAQWVVWRYADSGERIAIAYVLTSAEDAQRIADAINACDGI